MTTKKKRDKDSRAPLIYDVRVLLPMTSTQREAVRVAAKREGVAATEWVRRAVQARLERMAFLTEEP